MIYEVCRKAGCPDADTKGKTCNPGSCGMLDEKSHLAEKREYLLCAPPIVLEKKSEEK